MPVTSPWKTWREGGLEGGDGGFALVPCGFGTEEDAVPVVVGEGFAVVVPDGVELAGGSEFLAVVGELLDVGEGVVPVGIDAGPVVDAGGDPGLEVGVGEGRDEAGEAAGLRVVLPGYGDGGVLEGVGHGFEERGFFVGDVTPEEELAMEGLEVGDDLLHEVEVDGAEALCVYGGLGLAFA